MKICIVGGTGHISTSIARLLMESGHEVVLFNRGKSGGAPVGARVIVGDRADTITFERAMQEEKFDAAIDMICFNKEQAQSSIRAFRGVRQFIQTSTVVTYGFHYDWFPGTEDHPKRSTSPYGKGKIEADHAFMAAYHETGFPVTIIKPSTTYGPKNGLLRQVAWEFTWLDRMRKGLPLIVCGDGNALHQFLHVDDAAFAFAGVLGKERCVGQTYNMVGKQAVTWADYHRAAMRAIGHQVELVGVPIVDLAKYQIPGFGICVDIFAHHVVFSNEKIYRDVPEFRPKISLEEGLHQSIEQMTHNGQIPDASSNTWEDLIIAAQRGAHGAA